MAQAIGHVALQQREFDHEQMFECHHIVGYSWSWIEVTQVSEYRRRKAEVISEECEAGRVAGKTTERCGWKVEERPGASQWTREGTTKCIERCRNSRSWLSSSQVLGSLCDSVVSRAVETEATRHGLESEREVRKQKQGNQGAISRNLSLTKMEQLDNSWSEGTSRNGISVCSGCHNRLQPTGWLKPQKNLFSLEARSL